VPRWPFAPPLGKTREKRVRSRPSTLCTYPVSLVSLPHTSTPQGLKSGFFSGAIRHDSTSCSSRSWSFPPQLLGVGGNTVNCGFPTGALGPVRNDKRMENEGAARPGSQAANMSSPRPTVLGDVSPRIVSLNHSRTLSRAPRH
jgi:hypothetical protein